MAQGSRLVRQRSSQHGLEGLRVGLTQAIESAQPSTREERESSLAPNLEFAPHLALLVGSQWMLKRIANLPTLRNLPNVLPSGT
jgi:hypothetical protein